MSREKLTSYLLFLLLHLKSKPQPTNGSPFSSSFEIKNGLRNRKNQKCVFDKKVENLQIKDWRNTNLREKINLKKGRKNDREAFKSREKSAHKNENEHQQCRNRVCQNIKNTHDSRWKWITFTIYLLNLNQFDKYGVLTWDEMERDWIWKKERKLFLIVEKLTREREDVW